MLLLALIVILFSMLILLVAFFAHTTKYDKLLVVNSFSTHTVALMAFFAAANDTYEILDIISIYVCVGFITSIAIFNFFNEKKKS